MQLGSRRRWLRGLHSVRCGGLVHVFDNGGLWLQATTWSSGRYPGKVLHQPLGPSLRQGTWQASG